jgi:hypothetical protein
MIDECIAHGRRPRLIVRIFPLAGAVLNGENDDLFRIVIDAVINEVAIFADGDLAHALGTLAAADMRKLDQVLQCVEYGGAYPLRALRALGQEIGGNGFETGKRARRIIEASCAIETAEGGLDLLRCCEVAAFCLGEAFKHRGQMGRVDRFRLFLVSGQRKHGPGNVILGLRRQSADFIDGVIKEFAHTVIVAGLAVAIP